MWKIGGIESLVRVAVESLATRFLILSLPPPPLLFLLALSLSFSLLLSSLCLSQTRVCCASGASRLGACLSYLATASPTSTHLTRFHYFFFTRSLGFPSFFSHFTFFTLFLNYSFVLKTFRCHVLLQYLANPKFQVARSFFLES